ncbi:MAG TPA: galactose-1-phosphate uridylyltransferase [Actinomycetota bacterium]|nr:galactose-1-phosphate uridylyltransferase [Actinomycetota bacterium]
MSTLRQDPTTNEWVIVAPGRALRPHSEHVHGRPRLPEWDAGCPFCPGNEDQTPPQIMRVPGEGPWEQRVVPNRYPALEAGGTTERSGDGGARRMGGVGFHEVLVESPRHDERMDEMPVDRVAAVIALWRERYRVLKREPSVKAVIVFKNFGERAGTSLLHPHSQILATPVFPPEQLHRYAVATRYFDDTGHCVYVDLLERERRERERVVIENDEFVAVSPFAAALPFETWIAPRRHETSFDRLDDDRIPALAEVVRTLLGGLRRSAGDPDYNLVLQSAPALEEQKPFFQWHLRLLPRMSTPAGFELATGMSINTVPPEDAARLLREATAGVL